MKNTHNFKHVDLIEIQVMMRMFIIMKTRAINQKSQPSGNYDSIYVSHHSLQK